MLDITLLGTGGNMPMPYRNLSATIIAYKGKKILIDCGEGSQVVMREVGAGFKSVDIICITHIHGDHIIGLPGMLGTIGNSGRVEKLTIIGPEGIKEAVKGLRVIVPYLPYEIDIIECKNNILNINIIEDSLRVGNKSFNEMVIETLELDHSANCIGYKFILNRAAKFDVDKAISNNIPKKYWKILQKGERIENFSPEMVLGDTREGIKVTYITDTRPIKTIPEFIKKSNLLIGEGNYGADEDVDKAIMNKHMTFRELATLAKLGEVDKLVITHFSPSMMNPEEYKDNAKEVFCNTVIGEDKMKITLNYKEDL